jgi:hypothetical protein
MTSLLIRVDTTVNTNVKGSKVFGLAFVKVAGVTDVFTQDEVRAFVLPKLSEPETLVGSAIVQLDNVSSGGESANHSGRGDERFTGVLTKVFLNGIVDDSVTTNMADVTGAAGVDVYFLTVDGINETAVRSIKANDNIPVITNRVLHLDAITTSTYTLSGTGVSSIADKADYLTVEAIPLSNAIDSGTTTPVQISSINGHPAFSFDNTSLFLSGKYTAPANQDFTVVQVVELSAYMDRLGGTFVYPYGYPGSDNGFLLERVGTYYNVQTDNRYYNQWTFVIDTPVVIVATLSNNQTTVGMSVTKISDGTELVAYAEITNTRIYPFSSGSSSYPTDNRIGIGRSDNRKSGSMGASKSKVGETVFYDKKLTPSEITATIDYMVNKWK